MKRCVIVGGADINNYSFIRQKLRADDYIIFCDSGLKHLEHLQVNPGLIVGDFDSHKNPHLEVETIILPCEKDDTDTVYAVKEAIKRGFDAFLLIGVMHEFVQLILHGHESLLNTLQNELFFFVLLCLQLNDQHHIKQHVCSHQ